MSVSSPVRPAHGVPVIAIERVYHAGTLDPATRGRNAGAASYEGNCLSVSPCPHAWWRIARLDGQLHELRYGQGLFLDVHAVHAAPDLLRAILAWGESQALVVSTPMWRAWTWDEELDAWRFSLHASEDEARDELDADASEQSGPDAATPAIERVMVPAATAELARLTGIAPEFHRDATDFVIMAWAEQALPECLGRPVDGLWWRDAYDPASLSAPRGGLFSARLPFWTAHRVLPEAVDDAAAIAAIPATHILDVVLDPAAKTRHGS